MNKFKLYIEENKETIIILITILQVMLWIFFSNMKKEENKRENIITKPTIASYNEVINDLNKTKDIEIIDIENYGENWGIKIKLKGNSNSIIKSIKELENFNVKTYNIAGQDDNLLAILELNR